MIFPRTLFIGGVDGTFPHAALISVDVGMKSEGKFKAKVCT